jgi:hypothetical protein
MQIIPHFCLWTLGLAKAWTMRTEAECQCLERHAAGKKRVAEIGCWYGVNTLRLRRVMAPDGVLFAVDPYPVGRLGFSAIQYIAHREVAKCPNGTVRWLRQSGVEAARSLAEAGERPFDFIFSDSLNDYDGFRRNWEAWSPLVAPGGIFILGTSQPYIPPPNGHQSWWDPKVEIGADVGSVVFTREVVQHDPRFEVLEVVDSFTVLRRRTDA